jgi:hypothetical protein
MKKSRVIQIIREVLQEMSTTGGGGGATPAGAGATFTPGQGEHYAEPIRSPKKQTKKKVTKEIRDSGYKEVKRPKRPSHTDMFEYLNEDGGGNTDVPYAFTTEEGLHTHAGVKISEKLEMELVDKKKKSTVNKVKNSQETNNKNKK